AGTGWPGRKRDRSADRTTGPSTQTDPRWLGALIVNYTFTDGTAEQQALWEEAAHHLLNYPFDELPLDVTVGFYDPTELTKQTFFAETYTTYGSVVSEMKVRDDAPGFGNLDATLMAEAASIGLPWTVEQFYMETSIHELGHAAFAAL